jgi:hypothetical protein
MAIVTRDVPICSANVGHLVKVTGHLAINRIGQPTWGVVPVNPETYLVNNWDGEIEGFANEFGELDHPDEWLAPIRPEPEDDDVESSQDLNLEMTA